jgi:hypothetical protein
VIFQNRIAHFHALIADMHASEMFRRVGDECVYLILASAAERTSEDLLVFAALAEHDPSMASGRWKSRFAKVQLVDARRSKVFGFNNASEDAAPRNQKMACTQAALDAN